MSRVPTAGTTTKFAPSTASTVRRSRSCWRKARSGVRSPIESIDAIAKAGTLTWIRSGQAGIRSSTPRQATRPGGGRVVCAGGQIQPLSEAALTASARLVTPSFPIAEEMWLRTVPSVRNRVAAIYAVVPPAAAACSTSVSFVVSGLAPTDERLRGELGIHHSQPLVDATDRVDEPFDRSVLDHEAVRPGLHGAAQIAGAAEGGQHDDARGAGRCRAASRRRRSRRSGPAAPSAVVPAGICTSSSSTSGSARRRRRGCSPRRPPPPPPRDPGFQTQQRHQARAQDRLVIGDHQADHACRSHRRGEPGAGLARSVTSRRPPATATRASRPRRPGAGGALRGCRCRRPGRSRSARRR